MGLLRILNRRIYALFCSMNYIVTKALKSKGIAILLVFIFGPFGMFYSTIWGAIVMLLVAPALVIGFFYAVMHDMATPAFCMLFIFFAIIYYITCFLWAVAAVVDHNRNLIAGQNEEMEEMRPVSGNWTPILILFFTMLVSVLIYFFNARSETARKLEHRENVRETQQTNSYTQPSKHNAGKPIKRKLASTTRFDGEWQSEGGVDLTLQEELKKVYGSVGVNTIEGRVVDEDLADGNIDRIMSGYLFDGFGAKAAYIKLYLVRTIDSSHANRLEMRIMKRYIERRDFKDITIFTK